MLQNNTSVSHARKDAAVYITIYRYSHSARGIAMDSQLPSDLQMKCGANAQSRSFLTSVNQNENSTLQLIITLARLQSFIRCSKSNRSTDPQIALDSSSGRSRCHTVNSRSVLKNVMARRYQRICGQTACDCSHCLADAVSQTTGLTTLRPPGSALAADLTKDPIRRRLFQ